MPEYPEKCYVRDALGLVESSFDYVQSLPELYIHKGITEVSGEMWHIYEYAGMVV